MSENTPNPPVEDDDAQTPAGPDYPVEEPAPTEDALEDAPERPDMSGPVTPEVRPQETPDAPETDDGPEDDQ